MFQKSTKTNKKVRIANISQQFPALNTTLFKSKIYLFCLVVFQTFGYLVL